MKTPDHFQAGPPVWHLVCFTGTRGLNKRMLLFLESLLSAGASARVVSLPRGQWNLSRAESPLQPCSLNSWSMLLTRQIPDEESDTRQQSSDTGKPERARTAAIMCFHWLMLPAAVLTATVLRVPVLYDEHDHYELNTMESRRSRLGKFIAGQLVRLVHRICLPRVDVITCIHMQHGVLRRHLARWNSAVVELHNYPVRRWRESLTSSRSTDRICLNVDPAITHSGAISADDTLTNVSAAPLTFVYIGGVFREKGADAAAQALAQLRRRHSAVELHIFGSGDDALIEQLRCRDGVTVHSEVTPEHFRQFTQSRRCCGLALLEPTPRYRLVGTNCTKVYEYLALGMPVIVSDVGELPGFVRTHDVGVTVSGNPDIPELAAAMDLLSEDAHRFDSYSSRARDLMSRCEMTWEHEWEKVASSGIFRHLRAA